MSEIMTKYRLVGRNCQDVEFAGRVLHSYSTQNAGGTKRQWNELVLYETAGGDWIADDVSCSDAVGETDFHRTTVIAIVSSMMATDEPFDAREAVMRHFGWTIVAKAFARTTGWNVTRTVA